MSLNSVIDRLAQNSDYLRANWTLHPGDAQFLYMMALVGGFKSMLEIGTSIGFSTMHLAEAAKRNGGHITSIDASAERQQQAQQHISEAGLQDQTTLVEGDALTKLSELMQLQKQFDLMFIDARKSEYIDYFHCAQQLLQPGGLLIADNTQSHREDMLDFIQAVQQASGWDQCELTTTTGMIMARRHLA